MKTGKVILSAMLIAVFMLFAMGSSDSETSSQGTGTVDPTKAAAENEIGKYAVVIDSCRLAEDYSGKPVVIVKYVYTNVADEDAVSFMIAFNEKVYQNGVGLNKSFVLDEAANYSADNQTKEIKKGATLEVEVAYELNDTTTDIEVEVEELFSFNDKKLTKTFSIAQ